MPSSLEPYRGRAPAKRTAQTLDRINDAKLIRRAEDRARAELAAARISDAVGLTRHGMAGGACIGLEAEFNAVASPWAAEDIIRMARAGNAVIRAEIEKLADPWS